MSNQIQNPNVKIFSKTISYLSVNTQVVWFTVQGSGLHFPAYIGFSKLYVLFTPDIKGRPLV